MRNVFQIPEENFLLILVATEASTDFERSKKPKGKSDIEKNLQKYGNYNNYNNNSSNCKKRDKSITSRHTKNLTSTNIRDLKDKNISNNHNCLKLPEDLVLDLCMLLEP